MPGCNSQRRGTARTSQISFKLVDCFVCSIFLLLCKYVPFCVFCVLFVCKCVHYCHRVSTQLQLNIYHIISYQKLTPHFLRQLNTLTLNPSHIFCYVQQPASWHHVTLLSTKLAMTRPFSSDIGILEPGRQFRTTESRQRHVTRLPNCIVQLRYTINLATKHLHTLSVCTFVCSGLRPSRLVVVRNDANRGFVSERSGTNPVWFQSKDKCDWPVAIVYWTT
jgi:hypothetical protein